MDNKLLEKYKNIENQPKSRDTERGELIKYFIEQLNADREMTNKHNFLRVSKNQPSFTWDKFQGADIYLKPIEFGRMVAILTKKNAEGVKHALSTPQLYKLKSLCRQAKNFSATFWWYVKGGASL